jgi:hypothetical protein
MKKFNFKSLTLFLVLCMILGPFRLQAQETETKPSKTEIINRARVDAERDAKVDANAFLWFGCGFITLWIGMGAAYFIVPSPSAERLMGKSADYVFAYTTMYRSKRRSTQTKFATLGCLVSGTVTTFIILFALSNDEIECCGGPEINCLGNEENGENCVQTSAGCSNSSEGCNNSGSSSLIRSFGE